MIKNLTKKQCGIVISGKINYAGIFIGAVASGSVKTLAYYIECMIPESNKDTFVGVVLNGAKKGLSGFASTLSIGIGMAFIAKAVNKYPNDEKYYSK